MIAEARSYGDLSENSEYDAAKNEQAKLYGRIAEIEDVLSHATIIEDENEATGRVGLGCTVVVEDESGKRTTYRITGSQEANPMEFKLSDDSPLYPRRSCLFLSRPRSDARNSPPSRPRAVIPFRLPSLISMPTPPPSRQITKASRARLSGLPAA